MATPIEMMLDGATWRAVSVPPPPHPDSTVPYVTHEGVFELAGHSMRAYQLSDGSRILDGEDLERFFGNLIEVS